MVPKTGTPDLVGQKMKKRRGAQTWELQGGRFTHPQPGHRRTHGPPAADRCAGPYGPYIYIGPAIKRLDKKSAAREGRLPLQTLNVLPQLAYLFHRPMPGAATDRG